MLNAKSGTHTEGRVSETRNMKIEEIHTVFLSKM